MYKILYAIIFFMIVFIVACSVYSLRLRLLSRDIDIVNRQVNDNYQELQNLKAEWNYLNNPKYLRPMIKKYLPDLVLDKNSGKELNQLLDVPLKSSLKSNNKN